MAEINNGGTAFPQHDLSGYGMGPTDGGVSGMSLRDYFAAATLPALIARHRADIPWSKIAPLAFDIADAMIAQRSVQS